MAADSRRRDTSPLDDAALPLYTVGQVAQLLGIQPAALRRLDDQDIVRPDRSDGGQRRYSRDEVERLREVMELTDEGVTLAGVRHVLELRQRVSDLEDEIAEIRGQAARDEKQKAAEGGPDEES